MKACRNDGRWRSAIGGAMVAAAVLSGTAFGQAGTMPWSGPAVEQLPGEGVVIRLRGIEQNRPLDVVLSVLRSVRQDGVVGVDASLVPLDGGQVAIKLRGAAADVEKAMASIDKSFDDPSVWESTKVTETVHLQPIEVGRNTTIDRMDVSEVKSILRSVAVEGVDVSMVALKGDNGMSVPFRLTGPKGKVAEAKTRIQEIASSREHWLEADRREVERNSVTIDFPGGTVEEFVAAVTKPLDLVPPIFQDDELRTLTMRPVKTKLLDVPAALQLLGRVPPTDKRGVPVPLVASFDNKRNASWAHENLPDLNERLRRSIIVIDRETDIPATAAEPLRRAAFGLGDEAPSREALAALLDAIDVAVGLDGESKTFRAKLHAPSNILILQGTSDEIALVAQIVKGRIPSARVELPNPPAR